MKKPAIPDIPPGDAAMRRVLYALKENVEVVTGRRGGQVAPLASTATLADVISKLNELINRLQD